LGAGMSGFSASITRSDGLVDKTGTFYAIIAVTLTFSGQRGKRAGFNPGRRVVRPVVELLQARLTHKFKPLWGVRQDAGSAAWADLPEEGRNRCHTCF